MFNLFVAISEREVWILFMKNLFMALWNKYTECTSMIASQSARLGNDLKWMALLFRITERQPSNNFASLFIGSDRFTEADKIFGDRHSLRAITGMISAYFTKLFWRALWIKEYSKYLGCKYIFQINMHKIYIVQSFFD